jgi:hypothetical protein
LARDVGRGVWRRRRWRSLLNRLTVHAMGPLLVSIAGGLLTAVLLVWLGLSH